MYRLRVHDVLEVLGGGGGGGGALSGVFNRISIDPSKTYMRLQTTFYLIKSPIECRINRISDYEWSGAIVLCGFPSKRYRQAGNRFAEPRIGVLFARRLRLHLERHRNVNKLRSKVCLRVFFTKPIKLVQLNPLLFVDLRLLYRMYGNRYGYC